MSVSNIRMALFVAISMSLIPARFVYATYVASDPVNNLDPSGLSEQDVNDIQKQFEQYVDQLNTTGLRYPGSPYINNIGSTLGGSYLGCTDQAYGAQSKLSSVPTQDQWNFELSGSNWPHIQPQATIGVGVLPHHWVTGISNNPSDPKLIIDPWNNIFLPITKK